MHGVVVRAVVVVCGCVGVWGGVGGCGCACVWGGGSVGKLEFAILLH